MEFKGWFKQTDQDTGEEYYTASIPGKNAYHIAGPGTRPPTPEEACEVLKEHPESELHQSGLLIQEYDVKKVITEPVELPADCYVHKHADRSKPERLSSTPLRDDVVIKMPGITRKIVKDVRAFLDNEKVYRDIGIQYRRGILLYGSAGNGKTTSIREIIKYEIPKNAIVIFLHSLPSFFVVKKLQEEKRIKVIVFEELVAIVKQQSNDIERILDFLDGETSLDNALIFATTNYPEELPGNIVDRPSRFDRLIKVGNPSTETRQQLLQLYLSREPTAAEIKATDDLSVAAIKEASILSRIHGTTIEKAVKSIKETQKLVKKDFEESAPVGLNKSRMAAMFDDEGWDF